MKFGHTLLSSLHPPWADWYVDYKRLKKLLKSIRVGATQGPSPADLEGAFLAAILGAIQDVDTFFSDREDDISARLQVLAASLDASTTKPACDGRCSAAGPSEIVSDGLKLECALLGPERRVWRRDVLAAFQSVCEQVDLLRSFSELNQLAIRKILKKHDKCSSVQLTAAVIPALMVKRFVVRAEARGAGSPCQTRKKHRLARVTDVSGRHRSCCYHA